MPAALRIVAVTALVLVALRLLGDVCSYRSFRKLRVLAMLIADDPRRNEVDRRILHYALNEATDWRFRWGMPFAIVAGPFFLLFSIIVEFINGVQSEDLAHIFAFLSKGEHDVKDRVSLVDISVLKDAGIDVTGSTLWEDGTAQKLLRTASDCMMLKAPESLLLLAVCVLLALPFLLFGWSVQRLLEATLARVPRMRLPLVQLVILATVSAFSAEAVSGSLKR